MAYFRKRGAKWTFTIDIGRDGTGKRIQKTLSGFRTKSEAQKAAAEMTTEFERGNLAVSTNKDTLGSFMQEYLDNVLKLEVEPQTYDGKVSIMNNYIIPYIGRHSLKKFSPMQCQEFVNQLISLNLNAGTIQNIMRLLSQTLNKALEWGYINKNVASMTSKPIYKTNKLNVWGKDQFEQFLAQTKESRFYPFYLIALSTGMRPGEITSLSWDHVDFNNNSIRVETNTVWSKEKGIYIKPYPKNESSKRTIFVPVSAMNYLKKYKLSQLPNKLNLVISGIKSEIVYNSVLNLVFNQDLSRTELPKITPHDLRHTHATYLLSPPPFGLGQSIKAVSERLGHAKTTTTLNTYAHVLPNMQESLAEQLETAIKF